MRNITFTFLIVLSLCIVGVTNGDDTPQQEPSSSAQPAQSGTEIVTPDEIKQFRANEVEAERDYIRDVEAMNPESSKFGPRSPEIEQKLVDAKARQDSIIARSDASVASEIKAERAQAAAEAEAKQAAVENQKAEAERLAQQVAQQRADQDAAAQEQAKQAAAQRAADMSASRSAKFPDWQGPWKTCPICGGTGRDAEAEREAMRQEVSVLAGQMAGTGGFARRAGPKVQCPICGGSGQVPDMR